MGQNMLIKQLLIRKNFIDLISDFIWIFDKMLIYFVFLFIYKQEKTADIDSVTSL